MTTTHRNRLVTTIGNSPGLASDLTICCALSGYKTFAADDDGLFFDVCIVCGPAWEIRTNCLYSHDTRTLARGALEESSTGSAIMLTNTSVVTVTLTAGFGNNMVAISDAVNLVASQVTADASTVADYAAQTALDATATAAGCDLRANRGGLHRDGYWRLRPNGCGHRRVSPRRTPSHHHSGQSHTGQGPNHSRQRYRGQPMGAGLNGKRMGQSVRAGVRRRLGSGHHHGRTAHWRGRHGQPELWLQGGQEKRQKEGAPTPAERSDFDAFDDVKGCYGL